MVRHTSKILQQMLQDFSSALDHCGTLCIKELKTDTRGIADDGDN